MAEPPQNPWPMGGFLEGATEEVGLREIVSVVRRRVLLIGMCTILAAGTAFAVSTAQEDQYQASSSLLFRDPGFDQQLFGAAVFQTPDPTREAATNVELVSLDEVADRTAEDLGEVSGAEIAAMVKAESDGQSNVVTITATDEDPEFAAEVANAFAASYIDFRREADRSVIADARRMVNRDLENLEPSELEGDAGRALTSQLGQLKTLEALQTGNAELVQEASVPSMPSSPKPARNAIVGGLLGLLIGLGIAFGMERLDRRPKDASDLADAFRLPLLTGIPEAKRSSTATELGASSFNSQAFMMLQSRLRYFNVDREIRCVLLTSAAPGDGKTTTAWNLARSSASGLRPTVVIEADFHRPVFAAAMDRSLASVPGLAELLTKQSDLAEAIQEVKVGTDSDSPSMDVIVAGSLPPNPVALLESEEFARLLLDLRDSYELIVIDGPPLLAIPDAIPLTRIVDGVVVVGRLGRTTRDDALHLRSQLDELGARPLGVVANRTGRRGGGYYRYGYAGSDSGRSLITLGRRRS